MLSPSAKFLVVGLTDAMSALHADLDATVPHGRPIEGCGADQAGLGSPRRDRGRPGGAVMTLGVWSW
ncbi:MAG TPA: hypothetical protein VE673_06295 [Pseudonocardiaceae bacterium]|nr:hypothetical protein [Pseudonocardiaceae bacterium]